MIPMKQALTAVMPECFFLAVMPTRVSGAASRTTHPQLNSNCAKSVC